MQKIKTDSQKIEINGREVITHGVNSRFWHDIYHYAMTSSWPLFFVAFGCMFIALNIVFAILYEIGRASCRERVYGRV